VAEDVWRIVAFQYETPFLDLEIYRLVAVLEASPALAEFDGTKLITSDETDRNKIAHLRGLEFPEVSRIVVSLAAIIRSALDADPRAYAGFDLTLEKPVGMLWPDLTQPDVWKDLYFKEACNKILHADKVEPKRTPDTKALTGELILYGRQRGKRGKDWQVRLFLRDYALTAMSLTP
jgi:hypothetical protein